MATPITLIATAAAEGQFIAAKAWGELAATGRMHPKHVLPLTGRLAIAWASALPTYLALACRLLRYPRRLGRGPGLRGANRMVSPARSGSTSASLTAARR
jgi:hypothetical protein